MPNVILFEDLHVESLRPIVLARPAFGITCGAYRLIDWIAPWAQGLAYIVRPHLRAIVASDYPAPASLARGSDAAGQRRAGPVAGGDRAAQKAGCRGTLVRGPDRWPRRRRGRSAKIRRPSRGR